MSKEFIEDRRGANAITEARRQARQISYLIESQIQEEINITYINQWAERNYIGNDYFLNWVKSIFKTENFLQFFKYYRQPSPSASLVQNKVVTALSRVFNADDCFFSYSIDGVSKDEIEELNSKQFDKNIFNALLYNYNDILFYDFPTNNKPVRELISIHRIVAIEAKQNTISRIAFESVLNDQKVYIYADESSYIVYDLNLDIIHEVPHLFKCCPADFISQESFYSSKDKAVIRKSIFSYSLEKLEEYLFLKTLQRMSDANGAIPVVTQLKTSVKKSEGKEQGGNSAAAMNSAQINSAKSKTKTEIQGSSNDSPLQAGSRIKVPLIKKADGSVDIDVVKNFINFFYTPVEALDYINRRISEVEKALLVDLVGDYSEENETAKNEMQVSKSFNNKQDKLRDISRTLTEIRKRSDEKMLSVIYLSKSIDTHIFYGSDFFLETQSQLLELFEKLPNAIERKNILMKMSRNRNQNNPKKSERESLLYKLLPFASDKDFEREVENNYIDDNTFQLQSRFDFYISIFESRFGDILYFYNLIEGEEAASLVTIKNLLTQIITENYEKPKPVESSTPPSV